MFKKALVIGGSGGIGNSCVKSLLSKSYNVTTLNSTELDLNYPERIFDYDLSKFDVVLNCTGHSQGTYLGFLKNTWQNQLSQINVNYISNLFLLKHFANSRTNGHYVWFSTILLDTPRTFHSIYASSKAGSKFAIDLIRDEATHIDILEVKIGLVKTKFRWRNFEGTRDILDINKEYDDLDSLSPDYVAEKTIVALEQKIKHIHII